MQTTTSLRGTSDRVLEETLRRGLRDADLDTLRGLLHPDVQLRIPGRGPTAGDYAGRGAVLRHVIDERQLSGGRVYTEVVELHVEGHRAVAVRRLTANDQSVEEYLSMQLAGGLLTAIVCLPSDPKAYEAFWRRLCRAC